MSEEPSDKDFMAAHIESLKSELAAAQAALTRFDAAKMQEEAVKYLPHDEELTLDGFVWVHYGDYLELRTFAAAQTVRADGLAAAYADLERILKSLPEKVMANLMSRIDDALKEPKT